LQNEKFFVIRKTKVGYSIAVRSAFEDCFTYKNNTKWHIFESIEEKAMVFREA